MIAAQSHCAQVHEQDSRAAVSSPGIRPIPAIIEVGDCQAGQGRVRLQTTWQACCAEPLWAGIQDDSTSDRMAIFFLFFLSIYAIPCILVSGGAVVGGYEAKYLILLYIRYSGTWWDRQGYMSLFFGSFVVSALQLLSGIFYHGYSYCRTHA